MDDWQFVAGMQTYWALRDQGLKKQANQFLLSFVSRFHENVSEIEQDNLLFQFCKDYIDGMKYVGTDLRLRHLPFQMTELLHGYLSRESEKNKMPQMRWAFQIFGHDSNNQREAYRILEKAYLHEQCDPKTVDLYFREQTERLWWGQHHFPEGCLITENEFETIVRTANKILSEKPVDSSIVDDYQYFVKLYCTYFAWKANGETVDFFELCNNEGITYRRTSYGSLPEMDSFIAGKG